MQPSIREGFGLVITEALWKGKPVIAANVGGIPFQVREGDIGYFYETPHKIVQRVISLLKDSRVVEAVGRRGREYVEEHFLMPDRIADYLITIDMAMHVVGHKKMPAECIGSFHPWFKMSKRSNRDR